MEYAQENTDTTSDTRADSARVELGFKAQVARYLRGNGKHRYIHIAGDKNTKCQLTKALKLPTLSNPKRQIMDVTA